MQVTRRDFIVHSGALAGAAKLVDGGLAPVSLPGSPERLSPVLPPRAGTAKAFHMKCVACGLCISACPNKVLRPATAWSRFMQPEQGFERGWCRPECTRCGEVCPSGALKPLTVEEKRLTRVGHAVWHKDRCLAATEGVNCDACARHCPEKAIVRIPLDPEKPDGVKVPVIDSLKCRGCGACEHLCPVRLMPAMTVKGFAETRTVRPMGDDDILAEARRLVASGKRAVVLIRGGVIAGGGKGKGVRPLLDLVDRYPADVKGGWIVDKVIGRAAAAVCVAAGVVRVDAETLADDAKAFLEKHGIVCSCVTPVPAILNADRTGPCPLEAAVAGMDDPAAMAKAVRAKVRELQKSAPSAQKDDGAKGKK